MRSKLSILLVPMLALSACAPGGSDSSNEGRPAVSEPTTQQEDEVPVLRNSTGAPYTPAADPRVTETVREQAPKPNVPWTPKQKQELLFSESLQDYQFFRYDDYKSKQIKRFGKQSFDFWVLIKASDGHDFKVHFNGNLAVDGNGLKLTNVQTDDHEYSLEGRVTDGKESSIGQFTLRNQGRQVTIFLRSYKAKLSVHTQLSKEGRYSKELKTLIDQLKATGDKANTWWVTNMISAGVTVGVSRFQYELLQFVTPGSKVPPMPVPLTSFSGDSVKTSNIDGEAVVVQNGKGDVQELQLRGDAATDDSRMFSLKLKDSKNETAEVMLEFERDSDAPELLLQPGGQAPVQKPVAPPTPPPALLPDPPASLDEDWVLPDSFVIGAPDSSTQPPAPLRPAPANPPAAPKPSTPPARPTAPTPPAQPAAPVRPTPPAPEARPNVNSPSGYRGIGKNAFFFTDYGNPSLPRTKKAIDDFEKNFDVPQVQKQFALYKRTSGKMNRWFEYAAPFAPMIEAVAKAYDMPPAFVFLIVRESSLYFAGKIKSRGRSLGPYFWDNPTSTSARGPFQIEVAASKDCNLGLDERNYFAPSACGAACYLGNQMKLFPNDYALGILAYYQGPGVKSKILANARYYNDFSLGFAKIARNNMSGIGDDPIQYVAEVLAAYFVAGDFRSYGFVTGTVSTPLSQIPSAFSSGPIRSSKCEAVISRIRN